MKIKLLKTGPIITNTYLIWDESSKRAAIIDPAGEVERIIDIVEQKHLKVIYIINTHGHYDHILINKKLQNRFKAQILIHKEDEALLSSSLKSLAKNSGLKLEKTKPSKTLTEGDMIQVGKIKLKVIHTPGHSKGSICLYEQNEKILFSGDTLFYEGYGRTDLAGGEPFKMRESLRKISELPVETKVYPGHGPFTTIGRERRNNIYFNYF